MLISVPRIPECPPPGEGVHGWILSAANHYRNAGRSATEATLLIRNRITRPPNPHTEIETAIAKAYGEPGGLGSIRSPLLSGLPHATTRPLSEIQFDSERLAAAARQIERPRNWRHWLWERSPKQPETQNAYAVMLNLFRFGEHALVFDDMKSREPYAMLEIRYPMDCQVPSWLKEGGKGNGAWFLCNPTDGLCYPNPRQGNRLSCRSEESITSYRYAVLESDKADWDQWLAFLVQLPIRIAAIYTSGGRSIHALLQIDAPNKAAWEAVIDPMKRPLKVLGADPGCLSAVRLTRLPCCRRPEKDGFQKLLYLAPNPPPGPLFNLPILRSRAESLNRWRKICPRWNREMQPFE